MNHVFSVTCCRSGQSLRASGEQPLLLAACLIRRNWFDAAAINASNGACNSRLRSLSLIAGEGKRRSNGVLTHSSTTTESFASLACKTLRSSFHSSAIYFKTKESPKQPPKQPPKRPSRQYKPSGASQLKPPDYQQPSSPPGSHHKTRYKKLPPPPFLPLDLNPSGIPIKLQSQEWEACVKSVELGPISEKQAADIFGNVLPVSGAQEILAVLQYERLSGTLDHGIAAPQLTDILVANALKFLRAHYPFDEDAAIVARIEREYHAEESKVVDVDGKPVYVPQQDAKKTGVYGTSSLDAIVAERIAKLEQREAEKARKAEEKEGDAGPPAVRQTFREKALAARRQESAEWVQSYKKKALLSEGGPPDIPLRARLLPSAIFTLVTLAGCIALATFYIPPPRVARLFPDTPPAASTVLTLIAINVAVFIAWRIPPAWRFMNTHFILVAGAPSVSSLLGNVFSHHNFSHLVTNMIGLWFIGTWLHDDIGRGNFLATYIGGGVITSFIALSAYVLRGNLNVSTLGASGALFCLVAARCTLHAGEKFKVAFLPEDSHVVVPALWLLGVIVTLELVALWRAPHAIDLAVDRTSHLAALLVGSHTGLLLRLKLGPQVDQSMRAASDVRPSQQSSIMKVPEEILDVTVPESATGVSSK